MCLGMIGCGWGDGGVEDVMEVVECAGGVGFDEEKGGCWRGFGLEERMGREGGYVRTFVTNAVMKAFYCFYVYDA